MIPFDDDPMKPKLPTWLNFGVDNSQTQPQSQSTGGTSFVDMLKKRLSTPQMKTGKEGMAAGKAAAEGGSAAGGGGASL